MAKKKAEVKVKPLADSGSVQGNRILLPRERRGIAKFVADTSFRKRVLKVASQNNVGVSIDVNNLIALLKIIMELLPYILALFSDK